MPRFSPTLAVRCASVLLLLALGLWIQLHFFRAYPQPILFGDPAGYVEVGHAFERAVSCLHAGDRARTVLDGIRPSLPFAGVGTIYGLADALHVGDASSLRVVFACVNVLGMLGCFFLAWRLSESFAGGLAALTLAVIHPSFAVHTGRLYPDPITGCLCVWAAFLYLDATRRASLLRMAAAGLVLTCALFVRSQIMTPVLVLLGLAVLASAPAWLRSGSARRQVGALVLGCLPLALVWAWTLNAAALGTGSGFSAKIAEDNFALRQSYPYGFWQYLDTDGWEGPYRLKTEPFYKALQSEARADPELLRSRFRQLAFTARYVASRPTQSLLLVLDNAYRLYDRPANPYRWDYPFDYRYQVALQRAVLLLALAGIAVFASRAPAAAGVLFVPLSLALIHGLTFPWPRYGVPALLTLIAVAGAFLFWLLRQMPGLTSVQGKDRLLLALSAGLGGSLLLAAWGLFQAHPEAARALRWLGVLLLFATPFVAASILLAHARSHVRAAAVCWGALCVLVSAHFVRDPRWHEIRTSLGGDLAGVEQEIQLSADAAGRLRAASEAFLVLDLQVPRGDVGGVRLDINGQIHPVSELMPTMPRLREATETGGRDWRGYPQWWALRLDPAVLQASGPALLRFRLFADPERRLTLRGDRFSNQTAWYEGPSFGDWPHLVAGKLEYDGDYRLPVRLALGSSETRSFVLKTNGERVALHGVHRIRLIALGSNQGRLKWESAEEPRCPRMALGFAAYAGRRGAAGLVLDGRTLLSFPLSARSDFNVEARPYRLCYKAEGTHGGRLHGSYFLMGPSLHPGQPARLEVQFQSGMSAEPMFFLLDRRARLAELAERLPRCEPPPTTELVDGAAKIVDASQNEYPKKTGRWKVAGVF